jgi:hypothetical protein
MEPSRDDLHRVPHSHRHATPSAPWPWTDLDDGVFIVMTSLNLILVFMKFKEVDFKQLEYVAPPIPALCDHSPERCNNCWTNYPQSLFPNWTKQQIRKAKIYEAVHNSPGNKHCICYRLDVNDQGIFTHVKEMTTNHGEEERIWDNMIHEQVS